MNDKKVIYKELYKNLESNLILNYDLKETELEIKEEYCSIHQLKNKKDELDLKQVKFGELKSALELELGDVKINKLELKYELQQEYIANIKNGNDSFPINKGKKYITLKNTKKELATDLKEIKKNAEIDNDELKALEIIVKLQLKSKEEQLKEKLAESQGKEYIKKDNSVLEELIQKIVKELGITI